VDLSVGTRAPDTVLLAAEEREVRLSDLCADRPAVLVFLRHFG
jgi:peroxiredoxin